MPYIVDPKNKTIEETHVATFQEMGLRARRDLEQWVIDGPEILGESLFVITGEYGGFARTQERLDVLAVDKQGNLVVVELKTDDLGRSVELQTIKYAAHCSNLTLAAKIYPLARHGQGAPLLQTEGPILAGEDGRPACLIAPNSRIPRDDEFRQDTRGTWLTPGLRRPREGTPILAG